MKKLNKKGFTLAELLIVVAIIAVLVAIAIPVFTGAQERARIATDEANVRGWYAQAVSDWLLSEEDDATPSTDTSGIDLKANGAKAEATYTAPTADADAEFYVTYSATALAEDVIIGGQNESDGG